MGNAHLWKSAKVALLHRHPAMFLDKEAAQLPQRFFRKEDFVQKYLSNLKNLLKLEMILFEIPFHRRPTSILEAGPPNRLFQAVEAISKNAFKAIYRDFTPPC